MSTESGCGHDAAAYALGALEPDEADEFRRHLETCAVCRDELATFEHVVNALPMAAPQHQAPPGLRRRVIRAVRAEPKAQAASERRRLPRLRIALPRPALAAGVGVLVALAVVGGLVLGSGSGTRVIQAQVGQAQLRVSGNQAELVVSRLRMPPPGRIYELWLQRGSQLRASTLFSVTAGGGAQIGVPGGVAGVRRVLVTSEPAGGSSAPTSPPLVVVSS